MVNWHIINKLSATSSWEPDKKRLIFLEKNWGEFEEMEYQTIIQKLYANQLDPITSGMNYGQNDIIRHLKKLR